MDGCGGGDDNDKKLKLIKHFKLNTAQVRMTLIEECVRVQRLEA